jgi:hypothetical protein
MPTTGHDNYEACPSCEDRYLLQCHIPRMGPGPFFHIVLRAANDVEHSTTKGCGARRCGAAHAKRTASNTLRTLR